MEASTAMKNFYVGSRGLVLLFEVEVMMVEKIIR